MNTAKQSASQLYNTDVQAQTAAAKLKADTQYQQAALAQQQRESAAAYDKSQRDSLFKVLQNNSGMDTAAAYRLVYGSGLSITDILTQMLQTNAISTAPNSSISTAPSANFSGSTSSTKSAGGGSR